MLLNPRTDMAGWSGGSAILTNLVSVTALHADVGCADAGMNNNQVRAATPENRPTASPLPAYGESGFTMVSTDRNWETSGYGHPEPAMLFLMDPLGVETSAAIRVTAGGTTFRFVSVDVYSSVTPIPYVFTGLRDSATVFSVAATESNTFDNFATVLNPESTDLIDTLLITLTNTPPISGCCETNPMGLDNIVLAR